MDALLAKVLEVHGGLENWAKVTGLTAKLSLDGPFWDGVGWPDIRKQQTLTVDARQERSTLSPFVGAESTAVFEGDPAQVRILDAAGREVERRDDPLTSFPEYTLETKWDRAHVAYFTGTANWNYFVEPFLFTYPGVEAHEIEPWQEGGETWRRLAVTFPSNLPNHNPEQVFYYDDKFLLRRMDYAPDITASTPIAHYVYDPKVVDGFVFYGRRLVHLRDSDGIADRSWAPIVITTDGVEVHRG
ncbi:hypothetical protein [Kribbella sancticallisti]